MPDQQLAALAARSLGNYRELAAECAHLCGCRRASGLVDLTIRAALELGGWTTRSLADKLGVSPALIQKRAGR